MSKCLNTLGEGPFREGRPFVLCSMFTWSRQARPVLQYFLITDAYAAAVALAY